MSLTLGELRAVAAALRPRIVGGQLQRIYQTDDEHALLAVRGRHVDDDTGERVTGPGVTWNLLVCVRPRAARVLATWRRWPNLPSPLGFTQRLRKELENARVLAVDVPWSDRVLALTFDRRGRTFRLLVELTGHHANAFLVDEADTILVSLKPSASRRRDLRPGHVYAPPPPPDEGRGPRDTPPDLQGEPLLRALDARFDETESEDSYHRDRAALRRRLRSAVAATTRRLAAVRGDLARADGAEDLRAQGELLKANLHQVRRGARSVAVQDWTQLDPETGMAATVEIPLQPELGPKENLERLFRRYRKLSAARPRVVQRLRETEERLVLLTPLFEEVDRLPTTRTDDDAAARLADLAERATAAGLKPPRAQTSPSRRKKSDRRLPYRRYTAGDGTPILVGRGGADNGTLTFRHSKDNDLWLHVRDRAGAHVIVRTRKGHPTSRETLLDAALLAAHGSKARDERGVEVHVTPKRHVRPIKGAKPGTVRVERSETLTIDPDPKRLERLLATLDA